MPIKQTMMYASNRGQNDILEGDKDAKVILMLERQNEFDIPVMVEITIPEKKHSLTVIDIVRLAKRYQDMGVAIDFEAFLRRELK